MFFTGDPTTRKRVDLGGRSSKERDRKKLLEETRLERNRRLWQRRQNAAAITIQKCYRGRKAVKAEQAKVREQFLLKYGRHCQNADRHCFCPGSDYLRQLFFFFDARNNGDFTVLVETCRLILNHVEHTGDIVSLFAGLDYPPVNAAVDHRVKHLAYICVLSLHQNRSSFRDQLLVPKTESNEQATIVLEAVATLIDPKLPWACKTVSYLLQRNVFALFRDIVLIGKEDVKASNSTAKESGLEHILGLLIGHTGQNPCSCPNVDPHWSFSSQMLTIPFVWQLFPSLKRIFSNQGLSQHYIHQMSLCLPNRVNVLPRDVSPVYPGYACLLGNIVEAAGVTLLQPACPFEMAVDLAAVATSLLETLPAIKLSSQKAIDDSAMVDEDGVFLDEMQLVLDKDLERQIISAIDSRFLLQLFGIVLLQINVLFGGISSASGQDDRAIVAIGAACAFLHVTFNALPLERIMTVLAYRTELVRVLWEFMKDCHDNQRWSSVSEHLSFLPGDAPGWLLPLAVFCPVYKHMLMIVDNEEFYEQEKPLSLRDIRYLIVFLRQALWQLLWINSMGHNASSKPSMYTSSSTYKQNPMESTKHRVGIVASELLSQLQDWNNRREFTPPSDFHADGVDDFFISQAATDGTKANEILKQAPFLIPFTSRVKIFNSQLMTIKQRHGPQGVFTRNRFRIRRDHILEDAYNQMSALSEEDLRGLIRVTFVNELGVEEAGIDGGGIFKDFMENITRAAFDVQYGLFKETVDHLLYPNPGSGMIHEQHLQFFHFLGTLLAKAMFEGILVDIPFATFFLSKLKQKFNYLNDLPSLDPELYRHLIFLKHYRGDISGLELYFVIVNNEYGEQTEEELLPGGRNMRVTNENVITFIHLVSNHRLNFQIRQQSSHFLRGFQQLIQKDWIDMFNEHELQLLISGSLESLDVDDLRTHTNYAGGYHKEHYVIEMFWDVLKGFSLENQKKFLKFVTGCSRGPLLGFKYLEPLFCIQRAGGSATEEALDRLPTSATCMNLLKLPPYRSKEQMQSKLMYAINAEAGFDLS
ncbi:E3 ubiquitin-protein ligase UPL6 [Linum perenne]